MKESTEHFWRNICLFVHVCLYYPQFMNLGRTAWLVSVVVRIPRSVVSTCYRAGQLGVGRYK